MNFSFKYKFILSFVSLELIFISIIVFFNFSSINKLTHDLSEGAFQKGTSLFSERISTPLIVSDLAEIESAVNGFIEIPSVVAIKVNNAQNRLLINRSKYEFINLDQLDETKQYINTKDNSFRLMITEIKSDEIFLGKLFIVYDMTQSMKIIEENKIKTFSFIGLEVILSTLIAFFVGYKLTRDLNSLSLVADDIANNDSLEVPKVGGRGDEIHLLSNAMCKMQKKIKSRNLKLVNTLRVLEKERDFNSVLIDAANSIIVILDSKGQVLKANKMVEKLLGYNENDIKGKTVWEALVQKEAQADAKKQFKKLVAGKTSSQTEVNLFSRDGFIIPIAWSSSCVLNSANQVENIISIGLDMRERIKSMLTMKALMNSTTDSMLLTDTSGNILEANLGAAKSFKSTVDKLKRKNLFDCLPEALKISRRAHYLRATSSKESFLFEDELYGSSFENNIYPIVDINGQVVKVSLFSRNITELKSAQQELNEYMNLVDENVIASKTDRHDVITYVSKAFCEVSGYSQEELLGNKHSILKHEDVSKEFFENLWKTIALGKIWRGEIKNKAKSGHYYWIDMSIYPMVDSEGQVRGFSTISHDITDKKMIEKLSITDPLTSLHNRRPFNDIFETELKRAKRDKMFFCLLLIDVDHFKKYNDRYGHQKGDSVLKAVSSALINNMKRAGDIAFRLGGEEFGVIYCTNKENYALEVAQNLRIAIEELKIEHKDNSASDFVTASFGLVSINFEKNNKVLPKKEALYELADDLLYQAKSNGRNNVVFKAFT